MDTLLLLLLDSRAPAGAHHHSGGMEAAVGTGLVGNLASLEDFCRTRLRTSARVAAAFAAAAARLQAEGAERARVPASRPADSWIQQEWAQLDAEFEARTPSEATRTASRQLGGGLVRLLRSVLPEADLVTPWTLCAGPSPHHPLVLGAGVGPAGRLPRAAGWMSASSCCSARVRRSTGAS
jgi:urease accessory protein